MRILVDISDAQVDELGVICAARGLSRDEAVRQALAAFIAQYQSPCGSEFGIWKDAATYLPGETAPLPADGLAYQEKLRSEW